MLVYDCVYVSKKARWMSEQDDQDRGDRRFVFFLPS